MACSQSTIRVLSTGGRGGGGGGKILPQTLQLPPQTFCQLNLTNVLAKNLSAIPQLLGPQNCLRMPQNYSQKAQSSKFLWGMPPNHPRELQPMAATLIHYHFQHLPPQTKILDRTLTIPSFFHTQENTVEPVLIA